MHQSFTKSFFVALLMAMAWIPARSQLVMVRQVTASSGGSAPVGNVVFDYTIGETAVALLNNGFMLTEGFQQPNVLPLLLPGMSPLMDFILFPNPALTTMKIQFDLLVDATVTYMLVNTAGQVIYQDVKTFGPGKVLIPTPVDRLAAGIYTVVLKVNGAMRTEKLIVQ